MYYILYVLSGPFFIVDPPKVRLLFGDMTGNFAVGYFAVWNFSRAEFLPYGIFAKWIFSPHGFLYEMLQLRGFMVYSRFTNLNFSPAKKSHISKIQLKN